MDPETALSIVVYLGVQIPVSGLQQVVQHLAGHSIWATPVVGSGVQSATIFVSKLVASPRLQIESGTGPASKLFPFNVTRTQKSDWNTLGSEPENLLLSSLSHSRLLSRAIDGLMVPENWQAERSKSSNIDRFRNISLGSLPPNFELEDESH